MKQQTLFDSLWRKARKSLGGQTPSVLIDETTPQSGKSWVATAICRHLKRRGVRVAPFQALSRSVEVSSCPDGGSIAVEQARQAEACGLPPATDMNPLRCVPASGGGFDVLAHGELLTHIDTLDLSTHFEELSEIVMESYQRLAERLELVVIDGMGGAAELDQASSDIANLNLAERLGSRVLLTSNADRSGVFSSVIGTVGLVTPGQ
jgi:adenosylcobyric acid synthase